MKLGIAGTGAIVREVLPLVSGWGWEAGALCGTPRSAADVRELCAANLIPGAYTDYTVMLAEADIDAVYVAVPNFLHYSFVKQALEAGRHVIVEKPLTSNYREAAELAETARAKNLYLFEAITTIYLPNYAHIKELLPLIGTIKLVSCNFSQYSRRYDAFRAGEVLPAFDPVKSGGALMDLNVYNLHWLLGLFGTPKAVRYHANVEWGIDTSGVLTLNYDTFQAVSIAAKDCAAPRQCIIQGVDGYILQNSPANQCREVLLHLNDGAEKSFAENPANRLEPEFRFFAAQIASGDRGACYAALDHSLAVSRVQTDARLDAGIRFPADEE